MTLKEKIKDVEIEKGMSDRLEQITDEFALDFLDWYNTSETCEKYLRRNYPTNMTMDGSHYKKVLEINKELLKMFKKEKGL